MFRRLRGSKDSLVVDDRSVLPSFRDAKESIPLIVMFVFLTIFSYLTLLPCTTAGAKLIPSSTFFPNASHTSSALGYWSFVVAIVSLLAIYIVSQIKVLLNRKNPEYAWKSPLEPAKLSFDKVIQSALMAFTVFCAIHLILRAIDVVFDIDFVIATVHSGQKKYLLCSGISFSAHRFILSMQSLMRIPDLKICRNGCLQPLFVWGMYADWQFS